MFKHLLVPLSGESHNNALVTAACAFAKPLGAQITFYHALPVYFPPVMAAETWPLENGAAEQFNKAMEEQAQRIMQAATAIAQSQSVVCEGVYSLQDTPYLGIVETCTQRGCDLIFMASHGRSGISALLLGSQTQKVLAHSQVPVLVYRDVNLVPAPVGV